MFHQESLATNSIVAPLKIQLRVIGALILRELITRYGRSNLGFLWLVLEPMLFTLAIITFKNATFGAPAGAFPLIGFLLTGYSAYITFRNVTNILRKGTSSNIGLLYHENVTVFDLLIARFILEFSGCTLAFIFISSGLIYFDLMAPPVDLLQTIYAWFLLALFSLGTGMLVAFFNEASKLFSRVWPLVLIAVLPLSGVFYMTSWLPLDAQNILLWSPLLNGIEILREGFLGTTIRATYSLNYLIGVDLVFLLLGFLALKKIPYYLESK